VKIVQAREERRRLDRLKKSIAVVIRQWREDGGAPLTREEVAATIGVSISTVVRWENEKTSDPRLSEILKLERIKPGLAAKLIAAMRQARRLPSSGDA